MQDTEGQRVVLAQVALDQFVHHPLLYFPAFYCLKEGMESGDPLRGLQLYSENVSDMHSAQALVSIGQK